VYVPLVVVIVGGLNWSQFSMCGMFAGQQYGRLDEKKFSPLITLYRQWRIQKKYLGGAGLNIELSQPNSIMSHTKQI